MKAVGAVLPVQRGKIRASLRQQAYHGFRLLPVEPAAAQKCLETLNILVGDIAAMVEHSATPLSRRCELYDVTDFRAIARMMGLGALGGILYGAIAERGGHAAIAASIATADSAAKHSSDRS